MSARFGPIGGLSSEQLAKLGRLAEIVSVDSPLTLVAGVLDLPLATASLAGALSAAGFAKLTNSGTVLLAYDAAGVADLANALALGATTFVTIGAAQNFTVGLATSKIIIGVRGNISVGAAGVSSIASRVLIDGATGILLGGEVAVAAGGLDNALSGCGPVVLTLAAGAHTVAVQVLCSVAGLAYCRTNTQPLYETLAITVQEFAV